jgi:HSP20 family molecular chaperone IbpA
MQTIIHPSGTKVSRKRPADPATRAGFRTPNYDCREQADAVKLVVYVPGVDAAGVEIEARGADLVITARKAHFVRVNWTGLHLEAAQLDYRLRLRLGLGFDYEIAQAEVQDGVLTVTLPKRQAAAAGSAARWRRVA